MPDYAGAKAAIRDRVTSNWNTAPIVMPNKDKPVDWAGAWPPVDADAVLKPWVYLEILLSSARIVGAGTPGNHVWNYDGDIRAHVFVPVNTGDELATQYAVELGEIFRAKEFYNSVPGYCVRTLSPWVDDGDTSDDDGNWFRVTMGVDFTYWHRG